MLKERRSSGVARVVYYRRGLAGACLSPEHVRPDDVNRARILHLSGITPALSASARDAVFKALEVAQGADTRICVDVNYRSRLWSTAEARPVLTDMVARADVVLATADEVALLGGDPAASVAEAAARLAARGPSLAVVKLGAQGAVASSHGEVVRVDPVPAEVVDPVGAGDAFAAGLLADLAAGRPTSTALRTAAAVAAVDVACVGDWEGLPSRAELEPHQGADVVR